MVVSFLIKTVDLWLKYDLNIMLAQVFSSELSEIFGNNFCKEHLPETGFEGILSSGTLLLIWYCQEALRQPN